VVVLYVSSESEGVLVVEVVVAVVVAIVVTTGQGMIYLTAPNDEYMWPSFTNKGTSNFLLFGGVQGTKYTGYYH